MQKTPKILYQIVLLSILFPASVSAVSHDNESNDDNIFLKVGGLCMGGAIIGTIAAPVIGTIAGCVTGAITGWLWPDDIHTDGDKSGPKDVAVVE